jgi:hypothetical protein
VVTLENKANVQLMTSTDYNNYNNYYNNYKAERQYRYHGGRVTAAPFRIVVPSKAHRLVAIDLGGYAGRISASISIELTTRFPPAGPVRPGRPGLTDRGPRGPEEPEAPVLGGQTWDVFISHAIEDKDTVARACGGCALPSTSHGRWSGAASVAVHRSPPDRLG